MKGILYTEGVNGVYADGRRFRVTLDKGKSVNFRANKRGEYIIPYDKVKPTLKSVFSRLPTLQSDGELQYDRFGQLIVASTDDEKLKVVYNGHNLLFSAAHKGNLKIETSQLYAIVESYERAQDMHKIEVQKAKRIKESLRRGQIPREIADLVMSSSGSGEENLDDTETLQEKLELLRKS